MSDNGFQPSSLVRACSFQNMYQIFDLFIDSNIPLPELPEIGKGDASIVFQLSADPQSIASEPDWFHHWRCPDDKIVLSCGRIGKDYHLRFPGVADFLIAGNSRKIECYRNYDVPDETVRHLLLDHVIPRILGQQGRLVLHASAVLLPNGQGAVFLGDSGWGKSTIASSFYEHGARLITDDCLLIETGENSVWCVPNYYGLRLFKDSAKAVFSKQHSFSNVAHYSQKKRVLLYEDESTESSSKVKLDAIFLLSDPAQKYRSEGVAIKAIRGANEMMALIKQMFVLDVTDKKLIARQFENVAKVVTADLAIYRLDYPHDHSLLPTVRNAVQDILDRKADLSQRMDTPSGREVS